MQIATDRWVSRLQSKGQDPFGLGRWSYMILKGRGNRSVSVITANRVCKSSFDSAGDTTCYMQQLRSILSHNNSIGRQQMPDPHHQFVIDLQSWITMLRKKNISIILSLDGNKDITTKQGSLYPLEYQEEAFQHAPNHDGSLSTLAATCGLVDVLAHFHPPPYPSTCARGKNRLDYIFMSDDIIHAASRSGILPLYSVFLGDHNASYVDIDATLLFTDSTYQIAPSVHRGLQLQDPRKVTSYNTALIEQLEYHKIFDKVDDIYEKSDTGRWTRTYTDIYEKIDTIITESMRHTDDTLMHHCTGPFEWSIHLAQAFQTVRYWKLRLKKQQHLNTSDITLTTTRESAGLPESVELPLPMDVMVTHLREVKEYAKSCRKNHVELWEAYLQGLADAIVSKRHLHLDLPANRHPKPEYVAKALNELIKHEQKRRMYRKIGHCLQPCSSNLGCLTNVNIPADSTAPHPQGPNPKTWTGAWTTITNPEETARYVCATNTRQYNQSANTPVVMEPLATYVGHHADTSGADDLHILPSI